MSKPTQYPIKKLIQLDELLAARMRSFRFDQRFNTESEAMRSLIWRGLAWTIRHPQTTDDSVQRLVTGKNDAGSRHTAELGNSSAEPASSIASTDRRSTVESDGRS